MAAAHFLVVLALLASALPASARPTFPNSTQPAFPNSTQPGGVLCRAPPQDFTVNQFTTFTPTSPVTEHGNIFFHVGDTSCSSNVVLNPLIAKTCDDTDFTYFWDGRSLTVRETYTPCFRSDVYPYDIPCLLLLNADYEKACQASSFRRDCELVPLLLPCRTAVPAWLWDGVPNTNWAGNRAVYE
jgi:hypothetical protein